MILFDGVIDVHYRFALLSGSTAAWPDLIEARGGQRNGLCGAAFPATLSLVTGLHTGPVPMIIEYSREDPPVADVWEDVVEVSFHPEATHIELLTFQHSHPVVLPQAGWHRARYSALGLDAARDEDTRLDGGPMVDSYLLQLWPAPQGPDTIVRKSSGAAAYWHAAAQETPAPARPEHHPAAVATAADLARPGVGVEALDDLLRDNLWNGRPPSAALAAGGTAGAAVARIDEPLAEAVAGLAPDAQRQLALHIARLACSRAPTTALDWAPALDALARQLPLPAPFTDDQALFETLYGDTELIVTASTIDDGDAHTSIDPVAAALATVVEAAHPDPNVAVLSAMAQAAAGYDGPADLCALTRAWLHDHGHDTGGG